MSLCHSCVHNSICRNKTLPVEIIKSLVVANSYDLLTQRVNFLLNDLSKDEMITKEDLLDVVQEIGLLCPYHQKGRITSPSSCA